MARKKTVEDETVSQEKTEERVIKLPSYKIQLKCKNQKQKDFVKAIKDLEKEICFGVGSPGTGKTYLALAAALGMLKDANTPFKKIVVFVATCESTKELSMGYLKGTLQDKALVYQQNTLNNIEKILTSSGNSNPKQILGDLINGGFIQFEYVNFVKGKTFSDCICIVEEAEDFAREDMILLLTRKGGNTCKMIISGDDKQISRKDLRGNKENSGLRYSAEKLQDLKEVSVTEFTDEDIVRDKLIKEILKKL